MHNYESPGKFFRIDDTPVPPANTPWPFDDKKEGTKISYDLPINDSRVAMKFDQHKARIELVDPLAIEGLAKVLAFGANKYAVDNWRGGFNYTRIIGSLERHLNAIKSGEDIDPESGLPHIDHVGCNWMFLSFFMKRRPDLDDRWYTKANSGAGSE
jgi:hypothetical protein